MGAKHNHDGSVDDKRGYGVIQGVKRYSSGLRARQHYGEEQKVQEMNRNRRSPACGRARRRAESKRRRAVSRADTERRMMIHSQKNDSIRVDNEHLDWKKSGDGEAKEGEADARTWRS